VQEASRLPNYARFNQEGRTLEVANTQKTVIVTGASQGIGAAVVQAFLDRNYKVVATSRSVSKAGFAPSPNLALVDGDIGQVATAANIVQTAMGKFGSIDHLVNSAGIPYGQETHLRF
jgi:NAD(P)-dependent dehydrogenase (short-subunit alcohol dehydrogenase family)